ncbi:MAG: hypothetical protein ACI4PR_02715 [Acutalibacteraceae bacterium]
MLLKNKKTFIALKLLLISLLVISCSENKVKLDSEVLENCAKWNWIALSDTQKWTHKAEAYFTYVPVKKIDNKELNNEELLLCGTWQPVYSSSYFYEMTEPYKNQYEKSDIKGNIFFCRDGTGYIENTTSSKKNKISFSYILNFEWKIEKKKLLVTPISIQEVETQDDTHNVIQTYKYPTKKSYSIGKLSIDEKYLIQTKNWDFTLIPVDDSFLYKKYGIKTFGIDCLRYKYTWIEDWGEPVLQNYIIANEGYALKELKSMPFYK